MSDVFFVNGAAIPFGTARTAGAAVLSRCGGKEPATADAPYLFCGNGSCRDCDVLAEGLPHVPACRLPAVPGLSLRTGGGGALSREVPAPEGPVLSAPVIVVGAGRAGRAAARAARERGVTPVVLLEARAGAGEDEDAFSPTPVLARGGRLYALEDGRMRALAYGSLVLATGAFDAVPAFPGSTLPGVFPMDLVERFVERGFLPGARILLWGPGARSEALRQELIELGAGEVHTVESGWRLVWIEGLTRVARVHLARPDGSPWIVDVDTVAVAGRRAPSLELARALGCASRYVREHAGERALLGEGGESSVPGVFLAGDVAAPGSEEHADGSGARAGVAAARRALHPIRC